MSRVSATASARTGSRRFDSAWEGVRELAAVTRRARPLTAVYDAGASTTPYASV